MIEIIKRENCCGCMACAQICPKKCIKMREDEEGFCYPIVDKSMCVECGACEQVCPLRHVKPSGEQVMNAYVAYATDEQIREKSSSGGLFSIFAEEVLRQNGVVFGAALDSEMKVHHRYIEKTSELQLLRGSKYVQSDIQDSYIQTRSFLQDGRLVLFSGTACQIAGLKGFLRKDYDNLLTIDILCHGVPSPKVWRKYLESQKNTYKSQIKDISFRNKTNGWKNYSMKIFFQNQKVFEQKFNDNIYMKLFLNEICLRPSCHDCKFKALERPSDITLGDCWGIESKIPEMDDDKGTSVVLIHSAIGDKFLDLIRSRLKIIEAEADFLLPPTADSRKSVKPNVNREIFFNRLNAGKSISELVKLVEPSLKVKLLRKMKKAVKKVVRKI